MRTLLFSIGALATIGGVAFSNAAMAQTVNYYGEASVFVRADGGVLPADGTNAAHALQRFQDAEAYDAAYFGAFAYSEAGQFGWAGQFNSLAEAEAHALLRCDGVSGGTSCEIIARLLPEGYEPVEGITLGLGASRAWLRYLDQPPPKAFALGSRSNYAAHFSGQPIEWARERALANCNTEWGLPEGRAYGGEPCVIIDEQDSARETMNE